MKKKRHLRKEIETIMTIMLIVAFMMLIMIDDFVVNFKTISIILGLIIFVIIDFKLLSKYGKRFKEVLN